MQTRSMITARRLINLYRGAFAIDGGWKTVNAVFLAEADDAVMNDIARLPCGENLKKHIANLRGGKTPADSIDAELLPYNGMMEAASYEVEEEEFAALKEAIENFEPDAAHIDAIKALPVVKQFGERWPAGVRAILKEDSLVELWRGIVQSDRALELWKRAAEILSSSPSDLLKAEIQADMPEYETYLPMFGKEGLDILSRLRTFIL